LFDQKRKSVNDVTLLIYLRYRVSKHLIFIRAGYSDWLK